MIFLIGGKFAKCTKIIYKIPNIGLITVILVPFESSQFFPSDDYIKPLSKKIENVTI